MGLLGEGGRITGGDIWYKGENLKDMPEKKLRKYQGPEIGMVFQDCKAAFCPVRTVGAQIYEALSAHEKITKKEAESRAREIMEKIGLTITKSPEKLSLRTFRGNEPEGGDLRGHDPETGASSGGRAHQRP